MAVVFSTNIFARDVDRLVSFYADLFGLEEMQDQRGPIYRALDGGGVAIGFNAVEAYRLLGLDDFRSAAGAKSMLTFEVEDTDAVERLTLQAQASDGVVVKAPYDTAYGTRQSVVLDPESNVFRINAFCARPAS